MDWLEFALLFVVSLVVTILLVPAAKKIAIRFDAIDYPDSRRVNKLPIPRLGGIAIFGGMAVALLTVAVGVCRFGWQSPLVPHDSLNVWYPGVLVGVVLMFAVGIVDDVRDLKPKVKFAGQIVAACVVAGSGLLLSSIHNPVGQGFIEFGIVSYPLTVFYLVAFANVINLIDGLDGLASGITGISAITILVFAVLTQRPDAVVFSVILIGACVGFLRYNAYPASIFMGDSGALLLGFSLGIVSLFAVARSALFVSLLVPILAAGVPILDTLFAIIRRKREHRPVDEADKGHIHHQLMSQGFSQRATVLIMWGWTAMLSVCAVIITYADNWIRIPVFFLAAGVTAYAIIKLKLLGSVLEHHYSPRRKREMEDTETEQVEGDAPLKMSDD